MLNGALAETVLALACVGVNPAGELAAATADLQAHVDPSAWPQTRYVTLYNIPQAQREELAAVLSLVINSVSRSAVIARPEPVPNSEGRLWRLQLDRYALPPDVWEGLVAEEPYWHLRTEVLDPRSAQRREVVTDGGWVGLEAAARLRSMTGSAGALARGDWLIAKLATPPHYYRFAGVPETEREFLSELGIDRTAIRRLRADEGSNLIHSGITYKLRRIVRRQGPAGGAWQTYDVERNTPERDPLRNPFDFDYDAGEHIARRPNGLHVFALYDRAGQRQDEVPARIARDHADRLGPSVVVPLLSCVRCHVEEGLRGFDNDQRRLLAGGVELYAERPQDAERLTAFYETNLGKKLTRDREDYAEAVAAACGGREPREMAAALGAAYDAYAHALVDRATAARELGLTDAEFVRWMRAARDPVLLGLVADIAMQRQQWEAAYSEAALLAAGGE